MKTCSKCGEQKPLAQFNKRKASKDGLSIWCKLCNSKNLSEWYKENKHKTADANLKVRYGISLLQKMDMKKAQNNLCSICKNKLKPGNKDSVDHCHKTGKIREILCSDCNRGLGGFKDSIQTLENAIQYLKRHS